MPCRQRCEFILLRGEQCPKQSASDTVKCRAHTGVEPYPVCTKCGVRGTTRDDGICAGCSLLRTVRPERPLCAFVMMTGAPCGRKTRKLGDACNYHSHRDELITCRICGRPKTNSSSDLCARCPEGARELHLAAMRAYAARNKHKRKKRDTEPEEGAVDLI